MISFGSGQPDLPPPEEIFKILPGYRDFKYGPVQGNEDLRAALAKQYQGSVKENIVITNGASEGIDLTLRALTEQGASVLLPRPYYYSYPHNVVLAGMAPKYYDLVGGKIDWENFKNQAKGVKAVVINSPGNPTGMIQPREVLQAIEKLSLEYGFYIIADEVYKDLVYDGDNYLMAGERVITIDSFSKTYAMCGYRIGYVYAREQALIDKIVEMKTHTSMNTNILGQAMALAAANISRSFIKEQIKVWQARRNLIYQGLKDLGLELWQPEGAFYVFPKMKNSNKVVNDLYYKYKVVTYDGAWFGDPNRVRFSYALDVEKIVEGLSRLKQYLSREYKEN